MNKNDLLNSSKRLMQLALGELGSSDQQADVIVLHVGVAIEHALKAHLCSIDASLVVDGRDLPSLLHAADRGELAKKPLPMIKTIGAVDAFSRVSQILDKDQLGVKPEEFRLIADARNGVAHIGIHGTEELEGLLGIGIKIADAILNEMGENPAEYWGDFSSLRERILDTKRRADLIRIEAMKVRALKALEERFGARDTEERRAAIASAEQHSMVTGQGKAMRPCPSCSNQGWVGGDFDTVFPNGEEPQVVIITHCFLCSVCGFALDGYLLRYFAALYEDIPMGPAATFAYADGGAHEDLWMNLAADYGDERRRREDDDALRAQIEGV
ncbi:hypothetical protein [Streptomyces chartreusis]|uniref:Uncharacterized protein n=1 Tax=Streptomyces chartreusis TaxID=1969 RepID=A0A7H8T663_STRCX|nr:hypothetical protein [Streptomyces chartreusis]QKZ18824.1 hypothetical protein HUT05_16515 [Streptomyces chartreusis]